MVGNVPPNTKVASLLDGIYMESCGKKGGQKA